MSRTRTFGPTVEESPVHTYNYSYVWYNGSTTYNQTFPYSSSNTHRYLYKEMTDVVTPGFHNLMKSGGIINNAMTKHVVTGYSTPCEVSTSARYQAILNSKLVWKTVNWSGKIDPSFLGIGDATVQNGLPQTPDVPLIDGQELIIEAYERLSRTPLNLWVSIGEMRESIETVKRLLEQIAFLMRYRSAQFKRLPSLPRLSQIGRMVDDSANLWLHLRYGLRPLIAELMGALEAFHRAGSKARKRFSSHIARDTRTAHGLTRTIILNSHLHIVVESETTVTRTSCAGVLAEPVFENLSVLDLLGAGNGIQAMWDLVPYSFVIDWFANVGGVLATWSPNAYVNPLADWLVETTSRNTVSKVNPLACYVSPNNSYPLVESSILLQGGVASQTVVDQVRIPAPAKAFIPPLKLEVGAAQMLDLLALARQFLKAR